MDTLKVAIVGTGRVAENSYLPCLAHEAGVELAYYNRTPARAEACAARFGGHGVGLDRRTSSPGARTPCSSSRREMDRCDAAMAVLEHNPPRLFLEKPLVARHGQEHVNEQDFADGRRLLQEAAARAARRP